MQYVIDNLMQIAELVAKIPDQQYQKKLKLLSGASIGQHVRHIVEFYQCIQIGYPIGLVDYNGRKRCTRLESETRYVYQVIDEIISFLRNSTDKNLMLKLDNALGENMIVNTSLYRELAYNLDHAIHHQAIIKMGMQELMPNYPLASDFGIAPSTQRYMEEVSVDKLAK